MKIINSSYKIEPVGGDGDGIKILKNIERAGKTCYKSEHTIIGEPLGKSAMEFVKMIIKNGHESVLEHEKVTVRVICDRGVSHEIVRHRIASYSQESTRYCNYTKSGDIQFIDIREQLDKELRKYLDISHATISLIVGEWQNAMIQAEEHYHKMIHYGCTPQFARSVLPNSLKTEIVMTMNLREWRHFFKLRAENKRAHPQLREITIPA